MSLPFVVLKYANIECHKHYQQDDDPSILILTPLVSVLSLFVCVSVSVSLSLYPHFHFCLCLAMFSFFDCLILDIKYSTLDICWARVVPLNYIPRPPTSLKNPPLLPLSELRQIIIREDWPEKL